MAIPSLNPIIKIRPLLICVVLAALSVMCIQEAFGQNYSSLLVNGLLRLGYPLSREDVVALDKISMRFNARNRFDVLKKILDDRQHIRGLESGDNFEKTAVICSALRLLDEMELPITTEMIRELVGEEGWQQKELRLLWYMAAKRDIDFETNIRHLIAAMPRQEVDLQKEWGGEISYSITDICDNLSFLTELFVYKGDKEILDALIKYAGRAYGYPKEYLSHMFVEILLQRPALFIDILSQKDRQSVERVINSLLFAVWRNDVKGKVDAVLEQELADDKYANNQVLVLFRQKLDNLAKYNEAKQQKHHGSHH